MGLLLLGGWLGIVGSGESWLAGVTIIIGVRQLWTTGMGMVVMRPTAMRMNCDEYLRYDCYGDDYYHHDTNT